MSAIDQKGFKEFEKALNELADGWDANVTAPLFEYVGNLAVQEMQDLCPVDTGFLRESIKFVKASQNTAQIKVGADYAAAVDKGHQTASGSVVPANPFFSAVIGRIAGGELVRNAKIKSDSFITATLSHYRAR